MELQQTVIWTIGHSTHSIEAFLELLRSFGIEALADVRRFPASRQYPHFNQQQMEEWLAAAGIKYVWLPELGGRRRPLRDSHNTIWRNASFRGYADYMETEPFRDGIERLLQMACQRPMALMCAEAVWWRCHRALIADYLKARGIEAIHILSPTKSSLHPYTSAARIVGGKLTYPESANALEGTPVASANSVINFRWRLLRHAGLLGPCGTQGKLIEQIQLRKEKRSPCLHRNARKIVAALRSSREIKWITRSTA